VRYYEAELGREEGRQSVDSASAPSYEERVGRILEVAKRSDRLLVDEEIHTLAGVSRNPRRRRARGA
jgi:hypothetical protein